MLKDRDTAAMIPVHDLERARQWYAEKLGFTPEEEMPDGLMYRSGCGRFGIYRTEFAGTAKHTLMGWEVDNLEQEMTALRAKGVRFEDYDMPGLKTMNGVADVGGERGAWFRDPEGNILAITEIRR
jgi:catechol 2,3-dioxygenase-like lactoylglutathione lyase family enzyme